MSASWLGSVALALPAAAAHGLLGCALVVSFSAISIAGSVASKAVMRFVRSRARAFTRPTACVRVPCASASVTTCPRAVVVAWTGGRWLSSTASANFPLASGWHTASKEAPDRSSVRDCPPTRSQTTP
jgi:hypothetical protein